MNKISENRIRSGKVILAPSGTGKTTWIQSNPEMGWEDADILFKQSPDFEATANEEEREKHYKEIDIKLEIEKQKGKRILSSLFWDYIPDAIVIPDESIHKIYVSNRSDLSWVKVKRLRSYMETIDAPKFKTIDEAVRYVV